MLLLILLIIVIVLFYSGAIQNGFLRRYKIALPRNINSNKDSRLVGISGFSHKLLATDISFIKNLLDDFIKKDDIVAIVTNQREYGIKSDHKQDGKLFPLNEGWYVYFSERKDLYFFEMLSRFWYSHQGNDNGTSFFGCNTNDYVQIISTLNNAIKNIKVKLLTSDKLILEAISLHINSVLFTISADGDQLYINSCNKLNLNEVILLIEKCIGKAKFSYFGKNSK